MDSPVEKHQVIFLNPDLAGIYTAFLSHRAGARVSVIDELKKLDGDIGKYPPAFPSAGTFHPYDVDTMATEAGFPPPVWERVPRLNLHVLDRKVVLDSDAGPGGLLLAIAKVFPYGKSVWSEWLQLHMKKAEVLLRRRDQSRMGKFKRIDMTVALSLQNLKLPEPDPLLVFFDMLSILVVGRGIVQLDIRDFPLVLAGFLTGWHMPARDEKDWRIILRNRLRKEKVNWHEVDSVTSIQAFSKHLNIIRCGDKLIQTAQILVVPEGDRYHHPAVEGESGSIKWENWYGNAAGHSEKKPVLGLARPSDKRPPINDNFVTYHIRPDENNIFTVSAPVEERYIKGGEDRISSMAKRIRFILRQRLKWQLDEFMNIASIPASGPKVILPGTAPSMSYPEGPLWGDDVFTRLKAANRLSRRLMERLK